MQKLKKRFIVPVVVFILGMCALIGTIYVVGEDQEEQNRTKAQLNAMTYAERIYGELMEGIGVTDTLKQVVISGDGNINKFYDIAAKMMDDSIQSIQIAPNGVVTEIYPKEGNESGKIDLINDSDRGEISRYARDNDTVIMQGTFKLKQGGYGIAVRNPVYLENENGQKSFWGFTIVILKVPEIFSESVEALSNFGFKYSLQKCASPWDDTYEWVYGSKKELNDPVIYDFDVYRDKWRLEILPKSGFYNNSNLIYMFIGGVIIVLLLTGLTVALISINENRKLFKKLAVTDTLTGIYNRLGFNRQVEQYMRQNPQKHCVVAMLDIDDFKLVNDVYGHAAGDGVLQKLAESMKQYFSKDVILGRNGGDEFCIFMPDCTAVEVKPFLKKFTEETRNFYCKGEAHTFTISLGFAEYPVLADECSKLMRCADMALYAVKMRGKNGCIAYREGEQVKSRAKLGFAMKDIINNLPGAFIVYRADKENDEILLANSELLRLTGCKNMDELLAYTGKSFCNLIRPDEQESCQKSIWSQIDGGHSNDYIFFHMRKADGKYISVLDHGRIVDSVHNGRIFYVMIMDLKSLQMHYGDCLELVEK
ncbi:diguanylate cyclase [Clostridium sp. AM49-4BH]|uniref:diguanylate cyclase domain-containing protein n=1 Tax=Clostridium sp. AM49-4BH TaxID=2293035 RepID=UPI000E52625A|nr:diguanylate cyclase [Clostridium sp. AM49-4BH]RHQ13098.1 diguanylate cyclase [Clostridium sp. AM49-4BH]